MRELDQELRVSCPDIDGLNEPPYYNLNTPRVVPEGLMGSWRFVQEQAYDGIEVNGYPPNQIVFATPTYPFFKNLEGKSRHSTIYILNTNEAPCPSTLLISPVKPDGTIDIVPAIKPESFLAFFELVKRWHDNSGASEDNVVIGFNLCSWNHVLGSMRNADCDAFLKDQTRKKLFQSVPIFHGHVFERPSDQNVTVKLNWNDHGVTDIILAKFAKEMQRTELSDTELHDGVNSMLFDERTWTAWQSFESELITAISQNDLYRSVTHSIVDRLRNDNSRPPYGFEICTRFHHLSEIINNGDAIGAILTQYEMIVAKHIPYDQINEGVFLPGYNFNFTIFKEEGFYKLVFTPRSTVKAGTAESLGFIIHRPNRNGKT